MATHAPVETLETMVDRLIELPETSAPFLTLYLDGRPDANGRDQYGAFLKKELRARRRGMDAAARGSYDQDAARIETWVATSLPRSANGAAIFACAAAGVFEAAALDAPMEGNRLHVDRGPHLYPLLYMLDRYRRYAAVVAGTSFTRIHVFGLNTRLATRELEGQKRHGVEGLAPSEPRYQRHVGEHYRHHVKDVARALDEVVRDEKIETVLLAGDDVVLPLLRDALTPAVAAKVADAMHLDARTPEHEVLRATLEAFRRHDARSDAEKVSRALDEFRAGGLGVAGVRYTRVALEMGQVDELLLTADPSGLTLDEAEVAENGEDLRAVTAEVLATRARQTDARVTFVEDASLLREVGGVAALLRFRIAPRGQGSVVT